MFFFQTMNGPSYRRIKRIFDIAGAISLLVFFLPALPLIALLIKLTSPGAILHRSLVVGENGVPFYLYKFRTMFENHDNSHHKKVTRESVQENKPCSIDENGQPFYKIKDDERITAIGRILRRLSLDELPQLMNVLRGDMSLVGPRPSIIYEFQHYKDHHKERLLVPPGITGLYQVTKRYRANFEEMVALDIEYIQKRNLIQDIKIILKTPLAMLKGL